MAYLVSLPNQGHEGSPKILRSDSPTLIERWIRAEDRPGFSVYECPNPLKPGATRHGKDSIAAIIEIFTDTDFKDVVEAPEQVDKLLTQLPLQPTTLVDSGHGRHTRYTLKERIPYDDPAFERACAVQEKLTYYLAADPQVRPWSLLRLPGTTNSKREPHVLCHIIQRGSQVDLTELEAMCDLIEAVPLLTRKPRLVNGHTIGNGGEHKPPIDVDARLTAMTFQGAGDSSIHQTQLSVTASLLRSGVALEEAVRTVLEATRAAVADDPTWDWRREELAILRMSADFIVKHPELTALLPDKWREPFEAALTDGRRADFGLNSYGFYVRSPKSKTEPRTESETEPKAVDSPASEATREPVHKAKSRAWSYYDHTESKPQRWCIKQLLPETGVGILSGQWGSFKTTAALDMSVSAMTAKEFADQYRIKRKGAVLYFATEGAGTLQSRLAAIARHRGAPEKLPFAWRSDCPMLTDKGAGETMVKMVDEAATHFKDTYGLPITLIWVDTYITAAGLHSSGDDNDVATTQKAFSTLRFVAAHSKAFVVTIDHLGKAVEAGTRGSSGKEGNADTVLATLADREITGAVSNARMAVRKQRDSISGFEVPFTPEMVDLGLDEDGDPVTAIVLRWNKQRHEQPGKKRKSKDTELLCHVLAEVVAKKGFAFRPDPGGPTVQACHGAVLRAEFYQRRLANGTPAQKLDKRRKAYDRSMRATIATALIAMQELNGEEIVWIK
jgi:hypothetical protein